jgi:tetratricopeptide (TPR) repeat protein
MGTKQKKNDKLERASVVTNNGEPSVIQSPYFFLFLILLISFIAYLPSLHNGFAWDDDGYIQNDPLIYSLNLKDIFSTFKLGNYHPLTMLMLAIEYHFFGFQATGYHIVNLLIHLANTVLVFYFVSGLTPGPSPKERGENRQVALIAALLFGVHPIHVESVAWISELKDLLYAGFFLGSCICYRKYINNGRRKFYIYSLILFLCSLLSKGMATSLPLVLLLIDYLKGRNLNKTLWFEKIPFFALSIIFGIVAVLAQHSYGSIQDTTLFTFPQRIVFACYGFITYLLKLILPLNLTAYYSYPIKNGGQIPAWYYLYLLLFLALLFSIWRLVFSVGAKRKIKLQTSNFKPQTLLFGLGFFFATIFLVLQLLPVGNTIMADRYAYIPSVGIFYLLALGLTPGPSAKERGVRALLRPSLLVAFVVFFSIKTYSRCSVWKNDLALWGDIVSQDQNIPIAWYNLGMTLKNDSTMAEDAVGDFTHAVQLQPSFFEAYNNRGILLMKSKRYDEAIADYNKSLSIKPDYAEAFFNRGQLMMDMNQREDAKRDFQKAIGLNHKNADAHNNLGIILAGENKFDEAITNYNKAIELKPDFTQAYYNRGNLFKKENRFDEALSDYTKAITLQPDLSEGYNNRGLLYMKLKKYDDAIKDFDKAIAIQPTYAESYFNRGITFTNERKLSEAIEDFNNAINYRPGWADAYYNRAIVEYNTGQKEAACKDLQQAASLGFQSAAAAYQKFCEDKK